MMHDEDDLQAAMVKRLEEYRQLKLLSFFHVPNGGRRNPREGARLKKQGVIPGVADLAIMWKHGKIVYVEVKIPGKYQSKSQQDWEKEVRYFKFDYFVVKSLVEMEELLEILGISKNVK